MPIFRPLTKQWIRLFVDALLPGRCLLCADPSGAHALCAPCLHGLPPVVPACPVCALPQGTAGVVCGDCQRDPPPWHRAWVPLRYEFPVDVLVRDLKYRGNLAAGAALADAMAMAPRPHVGTGDPPWLVPVPLHWTRELRRGFNQAMELAQALSRVTGWPVNTSLVRTRRTVPQAGLDARARRRNLHDAFRWRGPSLAGRRLLLVDDVLTTGATARACVSALRGAAAVELWMAARALHEAPTAVEGGKTGAQSARRAQRS